MKHLSRLPLRLTSFLHPLVLKRLFLIGRTIVQDLVRCDLLRQASAMAYVTLISIIPSLVAVFCVVSMFSPFVEIKYVFLDKMRQFIHANLVAASGESVVRYLDKMLKDLDLAKIGWSSFASVLVTLILLLRQIEEALNKIWLIRRARNVFTRFVYFWTFLTLGLLILGIALGASSGFDLTQLLAWDQVVSHTSYFEWMWGFTGTTVFFFLLYKIAPNCKVKTWTAICGSLVSAVILHVAARLYGIYVKDAKSYLTIYGALAQLPIFLTWLYICWVVILLGALISWRLQEGFPQSEEEDTYAPKTPLEHWRDIQVRGALPVIALLTIYKSFETEAGRGLTAQELAHKLEIPMLWVSEALDVIASMGYVLASQAGGFVPGEPSSEAYFPRLPADSLTTSKIKSDFSRPLKEILAHWQRSWPLQFDIILRKIFGSDDPVIENEFPTLSRLLELVPPLSKL